MRRGSAVRWSGSEAEAPPHLPAAVSQPEGHVEQSRLRLNCFRGSDLVVHDTVLQISAATTSWKFRSANTVVDIDTLQS
jgi:hypothetical protein